MLVIKALDMHATTPSTAPDREIFMHATNLERQHIVIHVMKVKLELVDPAATAWLVVAFKLWIMLGTINPNDKAIPWPTKLQTKLIATMTHP